MQTEKSLFARAILLEQFQDGADFQRAIGRVKSELGPMAIEEKEAINWYAKFTNGETDIAVEAPDEVKKLIQNGMYLKIARATVGIFDGSRLLCKANESHSRYLVARKTMSSCCLVWDTFHKSKKIIVYDWSKVYFPRKQVYDLKSLFLLDNNCIVGTMRSNVTKASLILFCGTFDFQRKVLQFEDIIPFDSGECNLLSEDKTNNRFSVLLVSYNHSPMSLITFGIINNQVTYKNTLEIPFSICCPTLRDDKLFGFERGYLKNLIEFSLTDQTSRKHKIQEENQPKDYWYIPNGHVWIEDELLVAVYNMKNDMSTILLFDFFGLKWKKTKYELKGRITDMSYSNGALFIVNITHVNSETRFYQFQYHVAESLTNLTLKAIRQYLRHNPQFYEWFQSKLAKNSKIRTLW